MNRVSEYAEAKVGGPDEITAMVHPHHLKENFSAKDGDNRENDQRPRRGQAQKAKQKRSENQPALDAGPGGLKLGVAVAKEKQTNAQANLKDQNQGHRLLVHRV